MKVHSFQTLMAEEKFDMIVFDTCYPAGYLTPRARRSGARVVTIHHNWHYADEKDNARGVMRPFRLLMLPRSERNSVLYSDLNITLTGQDKEPLYRKYDPSTNAGSKSALLSNMSKFIITGNLGSPQNISCISSFLSAVRNARESCLDRQMLIREYKELFSFDAGVGRLRKILEA